MGDEDEQQQKRGRQNMRCFWAESVVIRYTGCNRNLSKIRTKTVSFFFLFLDLPGQRDKRRAWFELPALPRSRGILFDESAHHASRTLLGEKPVWVVAEEAL